MTQNGVVTSVEDGLAEVRFTRSEACGKCRACNMGKQEQVTVTIPNAAKAAAGDTVEVLLHGDKLVKASVLAYIFPLAAFFTGLLAASKLYAESMRLPGDIFACLIALTCMSAAFLVIRLTEKKRRRSGEFAPVMTKVITEETEIKESN